MMVTLIYGRPYVSDRQMLKGGEWFVLSLFALLGMFVMISGNNFLVIYLGLELLTLSSYALVALRRDDSNATEAAMKYFVLGALASGFLLYGLSMLYGALLVFLHLLSPLLSVVPARNVYFIDIELARHFRSRFISKKIALCHLLKMTYGLFIELSVFFFV
jgi:formate hydrogenlyase subunit 3/multisubunit Na+/H+ antiporter MnhD subunit